MTTTQTIEEPEFRGRERLAASYAFLWFFMMMSGYNVLRPIRETLVTSLDSNEKSTLFLMTFLVMLGAAPIYAWLVSKLTRTQLLHAVMHFFASNLVLFAVWDSLPIPSATLWLARVYFVWVSVFSLFVTSVFWSVLADVFRNEQGTRLFGPIASGGTIGAIVGSFVTGRTAELFSHTQLFWSVAVLLEFGLVFAVMLTFVTRKWKSAEPKIPPAAEGIWAGLVEIYSSRYLLMIAIYLALIAFCGTSNYMKLTQIAKTSLTDNGQRTEFFANINFWVQLGTLVAQSLLATPIMRRFGLSTALIILPGIYFAAFVGRSFSESLIIMAAIDISTRIGAYGIAVPAREVLFTIVSRDAKYKAKNVIDTVVFRGFDVIASFANIVASFAALVTVGWLVLSWRLGKVYQELSASRESSPG